MVLDLAQNIVGQRADAVRLNNKMDPFRLTQLIQILPLAVLIVVKSIQQIIQFVHLLNRLTFIVVANHIFGTKYLTALVAHLRFDETNVIL